MRHNRLIIVLSLSLQSPCYSNCDNWIRGLKHACYRLKQTWHEGSPEIYFSGYAWHNRFTYERRRLSNFNELAWGGGFGKGFFDEDGDWHTLSAIAFLDSHKNLEPAAGYTFLKMKHFNEYSGIGLGYAALLTARPDIFNNVPFIGILPWAGLKFHKLSLLATYIPGAVGAGNVLYLLGKWTFDSE